VANRTSGRKSSPSQSVKRVAIYARRSKDDGDETISLPEQVADCRKYVNERGWGEIVRVDRENRSGVSGFNRPVFVDLVEAAEAGEFEVLLTLDMSRFGRFDADERGYWVTRLRACGVETRHVLDDERLSGEAGPIMGAVLQTGQREHSLKTAYKVTAGQIAALRRGCWPGGAPPFGYRTERRPGFDGTGRRDTKVLVQPDEAEIVRQVFQIRIDLQLGYSSVARRLNQADRRRRSGGRWTGIAVKGILDNEAYIGNFVRGRRRKSSPSKFYMATEDGPVSVKDGPPQSTTFTVEGFYPPLLSRETWDLAQALRVERDAQFGNRRDRSSYHHYLLTTFLVCGSCGGNMVVGEGTRSAQNHRYSYVICADKKRGCEPKEACRRVRAQEAALTKRVLEEIRRVAAQIDASALAARLHERLSKKTRRPKIDVKALEARRSRLASRRRKLLLSDDEFVQEGLQELSDEDARLGRQIQSAKRQQGGAPANLEEKIARVVERARSLQVPLTSEETEAARAALRAFVKEIKVLPSPLRKPKQVVLSLYTPEGLGEVVIDAPSLRVDEVLEQLLASLQDPRGVGPRLPKTTLAT